MYTLVDLGHEQRTVCAAYQHQTVLDMCCWLVCPSYAEIKDTPWVYLPSNIHDL